MLLVCSAGGHLLQLSLLADAWKGMTHAWVTLDRDDAGALLAGERVFYAYGPTNRNLTNLARNIPLAWRLVGRLRPKVIVTTGAGIAVPFAWVALDARNESRLCREPDQDRWAVAQLPPRPTCDESRIRPVAGDGLDR